MLDRFPHTASIDGVSITPYRTSPGRSVEAEPKDRKWFGLSLSEPDKLYLEGVFGGTALGGSGVFLGLILSEPIISAVSGLAFLAVVIVALFAVAHVTSAWSSQRERQTTIKSATWKLADENEFLRRELAIARARNAEGDKRGRMQSPSAQEWMN